MRSESREAPLDGALVVALETKPSAISSWYSASVFAGILARENCINLINGPDSPLHR